MRAWLAAVCVLIAAEVSAQPAPVVVSSLRSTSASASSICVGCPFATLIPAANSGIALATVTLSQFAAPTITTNKLYNIAGALYFNGAVLATGSSVSGTANTIGMFTGASTIGNSIITQNGGATLVTVTGALTVTGAVIGASFAGTHTGNGAGLTSIPTSAVSTGNFVATVASGTGITSSVTTGNAAATTISLNNTAVTPNSYGSSTSIPSFTVDQQGRLTVAAGNVVIAPAGTLTGTTLAAAVVTSSLTSVGTLTSGVWNAGTLSANTTTTSFGTWNSTNANGGALTMSRSGTGYLALGNAGALLGIGTNNGAVQADASLYLSAIGSTFILTGTTIRAGYDASGNYILGPANVTDAVAAPTIASGFGSGPAPSIAGKVFAFVITVGGGNPGTGVINFNTTFANPPVVIAQRSNASDTEASAVSTTQATLSFGVTSGGEKIYVLVRGY